MRQLKISASITNRSDRSFEKYLSDISKEEMISSDEEVELTRRIKKGDQEALKRMVSANLRFVVSVAKQYQHQGLPLTDLISEGNLGLIRAAQKFDETRGFKFISYAVWWIRQSILEALSEKARVIRLPLNQIGVLTKINKAYARLEQDLGRNPLPEEIAEELGLPEHKVKGAIESSARHLSYDAPMGDSNENSPIIDVIPNNDALPADSTMLYDSLRIDIERSLSILDTKCRDIIKLNYGIGYSHPITLSEIAEKYSLTSERVRQIKEKGLRKLKDQSRSKILRKYL